MSDRVPRVFTLEKMICAARESCRLWTEDDWFTAASRIPRNDNPALLLHLAASLSDKVIPAAVSDAWSSAEFPDGLHPSA